MARTKTKSLSLGARIFLTTALLLTLTLGAAVAVTYFLGQRIAGEAVRESLSRASALQEALREERLFQLGLMNELLAGDDDFSSYLSESVETQDPLSLFDLLDELRNDFNFDFAVLLDPQGQGIVRTDQPVGAAWDPAEAPIFARIAEEYGGAGIWNKGGELFETVAAPVEKANALQAFLLIGFAVNDATALDLRQLSGTEIAFLAAGEEGPQMVAGTLEPGTQEDLLDFLTTRPNLASGQDEASQEGYFGGRQSLVQTRPLEGIGGGGAGTVVTLASLEGPLRPFRRIVSILLGVGLAGILLGSLLSFFLPRRILGPVQRLVEATRAAAQGDYDQQIPEDGGSEVGELGSSFNVLLSELREKRDMERYVNELSRNLPQENTAPTAAPERPTEDRHLALLGLEVRGFTEGDGGEVSAEAILAELRGRLGQIASVIARHHGKVEALVGHRIVASFEGSAHVHRAVAAASEILAAARRVSMTGPATSDTAAAVVVGRTVSGTLVIEGQTGFGLTGRPVEQLEGLLREIRVGVLVLSKAAHTELEMTLTRASVSLQERTSPISKQPVYTLNAQTAAMLTSQNDSATLEMQTPAEVRDSGRETLSKVEPGRLLGDRFEILSTLGSGGMGVVFKARDRKLDELVALKMLKNATSDQLSRFKSEIKLARKISHPNVLATYDFGEIDQIPFISMEYVRGITMRQLLDQSGSLPLSAGLHLARQLCRGLGAAHSQGVLHRDIKPENLIIEHTGNAKLMDFGIARPFQSPADGRQTQPGTLIGTPYYLAPGQLEGKEADARADIYASGVVLFEIFTGHLPFSTEGNVMQVMMSKLESEPAKASQYWADVPPELEQILDRCLSRNHEDRFPSADALHDQLESLRG